MKVSSVHRYACCVCGDPVDIGIYLSERDTPVFFCRRDVPAWIEYEICPCGCAIPMGSGSYAITHGDNP